MEQQQVVEYTAWAKVPEGLKTKTGLRELGLKPAPGQKPAAQFRNIFNDNLYPLYEVGQAVPRAPVAEAALARLEAARAKMTRLRYCDICDGDSLSLQDYGRVKARGGLVAAADGTPNVQYRCRFCEDRLEATDWAKQLLADPRAIILDTETTGLEGAEIVEIAIINTKGEVLFESLVKPHGEMGATHIHGITAEDVAGAPTWRQIDSEVVAFLQTASRVVVYNAPFDAGMIDNSRKRWGLPALLEVEPMEKMEVDLEGSTLDPIINWQCAMDWYASWYGEWSSYFKSYKWQRLSGDHRALGDVRACLEYIKRMATQEGP
jgi:DNA polymerase III epsilon subunit-like protein